MITTSIMRRIVPACLGVLALFIPVLRPIQAAAATVRQHDIEIDLSLSGQEITGKDTITVDGLSEPGLNLALSRTATVRSVAMEGRPLSFSFNQGLLTVNVPIPSGQAAGADGASAKVTVEYSARFEAMPPENPLSADDPSYGVLGTISKDGAFLLPDSGWYPRLPGSMPQYSLTVQAPKGVTAVSEGKLLSRDTNDAYTVTKYSVSHPLDGLSLVAGPFIVKEGREGDIPLYVFFRKDSADLADAYLEATKEYIRFYSELLGPYPFEKFAVVENFFPTGYGFASYTLMGGTVLRLPFIIKTSLGHEIVHSWFGNGVLVDYDQGNWSEGLTSYLSDYLSRERESAEDAKEYRLQVLRNYATLVPEDKDFPLREFKGRNSPDSQAVGYGKAMMVFHMARREVGDDVFFSALRRFVRENLFKRASWHDFAAVLSQESGKDMAPFFQRWVDRPGAPRISLKDVKCDQSEDGFTVRGTIAQDEPAYDFELPLRVVGKHLESNTPVRASGPATPFTFQVAAKPDKLVGDPDANIFRRLWPEEIPPMVNSLRGSDGLVFILSSALPSDVQAAVRLLPAALSRGTAPLLNEDEVDPASVAGKDVLFLGVPKRAEFLAVLKEAMPSSLATDKPGFGLDPEAKSRDAALVAVFKNPKDKGRVLGLYQPLSLQAVNSTMRKIQHYGKYSFLAFENGEPKVKGVWPFLSPLIVKIQ